MSAVHFIFSAVVWALRADARGHTEGGGNGGEHGDDDVEDFSPDVLVHDF